MPWQFTMLLQNVFASVYSLESRSLARQYKKAHFQVLFATFAVVYAVFLAYGLINIEQIMPSYIVEHLSLLVGVSFSFTIWTVLTFVTFRFVDASVGTLLTALNLVAVTIVATLLLGEGLNIRQTFGAGLLLISIYVIFSTKVTRTQHHNVVFAIMLSVIASFAFGLAITGEKFLLNHIGGPTYAVYGIGAQFMWLAVLAFSYNRGEFRQFKQWNFTKKVVLMGIVRAGAGLLFILAMLGANNASLIGVLSGLKIIITTLLAVILLKEVTFIQRKVVASMVAFTGIGIMLW